MSEQFRQFPNAQVMFSTLADEIIARLKEAVASRGVASLVVSGGTTPEALFADLSARDAPWDKICITLSDERWIAPGEDGRNEKMVRAKLLRGKAASARFVALKTEETKPEDAQAAVEARISEMPRPFDVVLVGMGDDGHVASLYPGAPELKAALDTNSPALVHAVHAQNSAATGDRMTLTLRAILDSRWIVILIKGGEKMKTYELARSGRSVSQMPVRALFAQSAVPVETFWSP
ncbi:MAG TPA: 6-phosphogluconolactonase [Rhizomicrobium sp.]|nr:6-phosphogluconolactonase [Rhizomicrobium sp.]